MRRTLTQTLLAALFVASATFAARAQSAQRRDDPPPPPPPAVLAAPEVEQSFDTGRVKDGTYSNDFFGFSMVLPKGWAVLGAADNKKITDAGKGVIAEGASDEKKRAIEASFARTHFLVTASKYPTGVKGQGFNAVLLCFAERIPTAIVKTGADYFAAMQRQIKETPAKLELSAPLRTQKVGGVDFTVADVTMTTGPGASAQRYYIRITKGFALMMAYTYYDDADLKTFDELIDTVKFR